MNLYTSACAGVLFPLHERFKGHSSVAVRRRLEQSQWWSRQRLEEWQLARLRQFLERVGRTVPYYRERFSAAGFDPAKLVSLADLQGLPTLGKKDIRASVAELHAADHGPLTRYNTGGSSGEPLVFYIGKDRKSHDVGAKWRVTRWWGVDIGDPEIVLWGSPIELGAQDRVRQLRDFVLRSRLLPAFDMSASRLDEFIATIRRVRPRMLFGYPSALSLIAAHAERRGQRLDDAGIRVAFVTSERLYDHQRQAISRAFACPVANGYGGRDAGFIAHECPSGGMHLMAEDIVVEIVDAAGKQVPEGESGELVVTHMATADFPFVRYRTGDIAALDPHPCACGRGLPLLREIEGRSTDFVVASDGTVMHGLSLIYVLRDMPSIEAFKIVQETRLRTRVELVRRSEFPAGAVEQIIAAFKKRLGADVDIDVRLVDAIGSDKSGKFRYVVSHVPAVSQVAHA